MEQMRPVQDACEPVARAGPGCEEYIIEKSRLQIETLTAQIEALDADIVGRFAGRVPWCATCSWIISAPALMRVRSHCMRTDCPDYT